MNDQELITAVRQSVHGVHMKVPADQIVSRSRAIRASGHRRLAAGITAVAAAGSVVLGLGLSGALGAKSAGGNSAIRTAAFTLTRHANGTDTLTLRTSQILHPAALQQALAQDDIPALVKVDVSCRSTPAPPWPSGLLTVGQAAGDSTVAVINPSAMAAGTELFFGYLNNGRVFTVHLGLLSTSSYTCSNR